MPRVSLPENDRVQRKRIHCPLFPRCSLRLLFLFKPKTSNSHALSRFLPFLGWLVFASLEGILFWRLSSVIVTDYGERHLIWLRIGNEKEWEWVEEWKQSTGQRASEIERQRDSRVNLNAVSFLIRFWFSTKSLPRFGNDGRVVSDSPRKHSS